MKFYQGVLAAVVWNPKTRSPLCEFKNGELETDDEEVIKVLIEKKYMTEKDLDTLKQYGVSPHGGFQKLTADTDKDLPSGELPVQDPELVAQTKAAKAQQAEKDAQEAKLAELASSSTESSTDDTEETESKDAGGETVKKRTRTTKKSS